MTHDDFLDPSTAERMLDGAIAPADAPPGFAPVAELFAAAQAGVKPPAMDVGSLASAARDSANPTGSATPRRSPVLAKILTLKAAAVAGVVLIGASGAAAATGALPHSVQSVAHDTLSHVGVDVPNGDDANEPAGATDTKDATETDSTTSTTVAPVDPNAPPPVTGVPGADDPAGHDAAGDHPAAGNEPGDSQGQDQSGDQAGTSGGQTGEDGGHDGTSTTTQPSGGTGTGDHQGGGSGDSGHGGGSGGSSSGGDVGGTSGGGSGSD